MLTPPMLDILIALSKGPQHGYALMGLISQLHDGAKKLGPATLYTSVQKLLDLKMIKEIDSPDPRRKVYQITHEGTGQMNIEIQRQQSWIWKVGNWVAEAKQ